MSKPEEVKKPAHLVNLCMTFDAGHQEPARFATDFKDSSRPDRTRNMPAKPMDPDKVGDLIVLGNSLYANFISYAKEVAEKLGKKSEGVPEDRTFHVFLNKHQIGTHDSHAKHQEPYAAVLSCIDAQVPPEFITGQAANDMFAVRTAGNILLERGEARRSLEFILNKYARRPPQEKKPAGGGEATNRHLSDFSDMSGKSWRILAGPAVPLTTPPSTLTNVSDAPLRRECQKFSRLIPLLPTTPPP